jgi:hypothetical protein
MTAFLRPRWRTLLAAAAVAALVVLLVHRATGHDGATVVADSASRSGWKTIEYRGVRVDIPQGWERLDGGECEFDLERWGPPEFSGCDVDEGVAFYASATFDPAHGPGVRPADPRDGHGAPWGGWISAGNDYAVYAADAERGVVEGVLDSVRHG